MKRANIRKIFGSVALIALTVFSITVGALFFTAHQATLESHGRAEALMRNGLSARVEELARRTVAETIWDEALLNSVIAYDADWVADNFGNFFAYIEGFDATLLLDPQDQPVFAQVERAPVDVGALSGIQAASLDLVAEVRRGEVARGDPRPIIARDGILADPIMAASFRRVGDQAYVLIASLVQPDLGKAVAPAHSSIVINAERVDEEFLEILSDRFLLEDARIEIGEARVGGGRTHVPLISTQGDIVATMH